MTEAETRSSPKTMVDGDIEPEALEGTADGVSSELEQLRTERDDYLDQLRRTMAEFANYRRRTDQERAQIREVASQILLGQFLPIFDDLQRALSAVPEDRAEDSLVEGVKLVERKFWSLLERAGVSTIDAQGQPFDPSVHEAVDSVPGSSADTVVDVYQPGYRLGQTLLRPAMVKVGGASDDNSTEA